MRRVPARFGATGWLVLAVVVLVPLLAVLQYRWLGQLSDGERERMQRTLGTAAQQLAVDMDNELSRALMGLQVDAVTLERRAWEVVAERYDAWAASAIAPALVRGLYLATLRTEADEAPGPPTLDLLAWDATRHRFEDAAWTGPLAPVLPRVQAFARQAPWRHAAGESRRERFERRMAPDALGDERTLVSPIIRLSFPAGPGVGRAESGRDGPMSPPDARLLGFTILVLDMDVLIDQVLPTLVRRHLYDADGGTDYRIAVTDRDDPARVLFESEAGAAAAVLARHDTSVDVLSVRPSVRLFAARGLIRDGPDAPSTNRVVVNARQGGFGADGPAVGPTRVVGRRDGHWRLLVAHQAGSLDAAVGAARTRNMVLSSGILLLLTTAVGLLVVSARRAHALARQQVEFVAAVTHELRTPVAVINSAAANLADGVVAEPARVKTYGETIRDEARRLGETVERVLQLASLETRQGAPVRGAVGPDALVREAMQACEAEIARHGATVTVDLAPDLPEIAGDATVLRSAVRNLLVNAVKYGGEAPRVRVSVRANGDGSGPAESRTPEIAIAVEDRGLGIAAEDRPHVFEPFYRGREAVARQIQGSGLGLSLVASVARAHGGRVTLRSEPGRGSTFTLHLPAAPPSSIDPQSQ